MKPDAYVQHGIRATQAENIAVLRATCGELRAEGMTEIRATVFEEQGVFVVEGWKVRPVNPEPCELLVTAAA
jgi:hypothetical protein